MAYLASDATRPCQRQTSGVAVAKSGLLAYRPRRRGIAGLDMAIIFVAVAVVGSVLTVTLLTLSLGSADQGASVANRGIGEAAGPLAIRGGLLTARGDVDVDGDNVINLGGADRQAVVKLSFVLEQPQSGMLVDLTPPYTTNSTGVDPDASGLTNPTLVSVSSDNFQVTDAAWTVAFPGADNGDYFLDPGERAEFTLWLHRYDGPNSHYDLGAGASDPYVDASGGLLLARQSFAVEVAPKGAGRLTITRSLPLELALADVLE